MVPKDNSNNNNRNDVEDENQSASAVAESGEEEEEEWMEVASLTSGASLVQAIERVQYALANDPPPELGDGSHILHVLLSDVDRTHSHEEEGPTGTSTSPRTAPTTATAHFDSPKTGYELCVVLQERRRRDADATIVMDSSFPRRSPTSSTPYQQPDVYGILHVGVSATMAGSESDYLPEAYRPLYEDLSLRNPTYEQFRERRRKQLQQQQQRGEGSGEL